MKYDEKISRLLISKGITFRKFSEGADIPLQTAQDLKHGKTLSPQIVTKEKVARFFNLTVEQLFDDNIDLPSQSSSTASSESENRIRELESKIEELNRQVTGMKYIRNYLIVYSFMETNKKRKISTFDKRISSEYPSPQFQGAEVDVGYYLLRTTDFADEILHKLCKQEEDPDGILVVEIGPDSLAAGRVSTDFAEFLKTMGQGRLPRPWRYEKSATPSDPVGEAIRAAESKGRIPRTKPD
ncbi:MAG: helix-turn-helix transcriptional regulator [Deltaproteobacteria bacterium]|jgi:transcriptional regulator with XRE-family HTH domain|nr:helix-turn-helix transcriptional regulator [Deltaproteobacteria bacterium]